MGTITRLNWLPCYLWTVIGMNGEKAIDCRLGRRTAAILRQATLRDQRAQRETDDESAPGFEKTTARNTVSGFHGYSRCALATRITAFMRRVGDEELSS